MKSLKQIFVYFVVSLISVQAFSADRGEVFWSDVKASPGIWGGSYRNVFDTEGLLTLGGTAAGALLVAQYDDDIAKEFKRHGGLDDLSSLGDGYGDIVNYGAVQIGAYLLGVGLKNDGFREFGLLTTQVALINGVTVALLKAATNVDRPDGSSNAWYDTSFPSGHAAGTAALAASIHGRYGFDFAAPFYLASAFTGVSRVVDNEHRPHEVVAGWGIGACIGFAVAKAWQGYWPNAEKFKVEPWHGSDSLGSLRFGAAAIWKF
jgi:hypothetical protein